LLELLLLLLLQLVQVLLRLLALSLGGGRCCGCGGHCARLVGRMQVAVLLAD